MDSPATEPAEISGVFLNMEEVWRDIEGYKGKYQVSNFGAVKSLGRLVPTNGGALRRVSGRVRKLNMSYNGYLCVDLAKNKVYLAHRLVAIAFLPNPENKSQVNHKNGVKTDNRVENLEWTTCSENHLHAFRKLGKISPMKGRSGRKHFGSKTVLQFTKSGEFVAEHACAREAEIKTGVHKVNVAMCCRGKGITAGGYIWKYADR